MNKCYICNRESEESLCAYHKLAYEALRDNYEVWRKAYGDITWKEYIARVYERSETGRWVKDVIKHELEGLFKDG